MLTIFLSLFTAPRRSASPVATVPGKNKRTLRTLDRPLFEHTTHGTGYCCGQRFEEDDLAAAAGHSNSHFGRNPAKTNCRRGRHHDEACGKPGVLVSSSRLERQRYPGRHFLLFDSAAYLSFSVRCVTDGGTAWPTYSKEQHTNSLFIDTVLLCGKF